MASQKTFKRVEKKFLMSGRQYEQLMKRIGSMLTKDKFGETKILNVYYDTPDFRLIRRSLEKPVYKEKLRLRSYGLPNDDTRVFFEIKKKFKGVVYKRRIEIPFEKIRTFTRLEVNSEAMEGLKDRQIVREIEYFMNLYPDLAPRMEISYDRKAYVMKDNPDVRITFDRNIRWKVFTKGERWEEGISDLLEPEQRLMEIKVPYGIPMDISMILSELGIYTTSFSKYGRSYERMYS